MIKQLPLETMENLAQTIQTSKQLGHVPAQWTTTTITMIPKILPGKTMRKHCE